jgi:hypothetical protein
MTTAEAGRHLLDRIDAREQALAREAADVRLRDVSEAISDPEPEPRPGDDALRRLPRTLRDGSATPLNFPGKSMTAPQFRGARCAPARTVGRSWPAVLAWA